MQNPHAGAPATESVAPQNAFSKNALTQRPPFRRLRAYAFDPSFATQLETAIVNAATFKVPWEFAAPKKANAACEADINPNREPEGQGDFLRPGPVGEYLEVVDFDPASNCFYEPVDLNHPYLLAQDGLAPSLGNPQFHQQMVYAVAMTTIGNFERALGRRALWSPRALSDESEEFVRRLRVYPHALREANAFYSPDKKALLFGYFPATAAQDGNLPVGMVFTCLSHDIIAHETTHALLDGMQRRFIEPSNPDVLAFHEAFADIVALFQHFTLPEVLRHQIARTRGDLRQQNLLGQMAVEFGGATGHYGALRDAIGQLDPQTRQWIPAQPDPTALEHEFEPHKRGSILVAAVFDAFLSIYGSRVADLLRLATSGSGVLPQGDIHPDLVNRLAIEASKSAQHILTMCIRALDYCPPTDITFGEYLRALINADYDLVRDDDRGYRIAVIEAFRRRGIYPRDVRTLSEESLRWKCPDPWNYQQTRFEEIEALLKPLEIWNLKSDRREIFERNRRACEKLREIIDLRRVPEDYLKENPEKRVVMGLDLGENAPPFDVESIRPATRIGPDGQMQRDFIVQVTQQREEILRNDPDPARVVKFSFRGGCTLIISAEDYEVRYCVIKSFRSQSRLERQRDWLEGRSDASLAATYFGSALLGQQREPFALLHRTLEDEKP